MFLKHQNYGNQKKTKSEGPQHLIVDVYFFKVNPKPSEQMNKVVVLIFACKAGEEHAVTMSKHKLIGRYETHIHKLLKVKYKYIN